MQPVAGDVRVFQCPNKFARRDDRCTSRNSASFEIRRETFTQTGSFLTPVKQCRRWLSPIVLNGLHPLKFGLENASLLVCESDR